MGLWRDQVEAKARVIHAQLSAARRLADDFGGNADEVSQPYLELLNSLYAEEYPLAVLLDDSDLVIRYEGPVVTGNDPPSGVVSTALASIRAQIKEVAKAVVGLANSDAKWPQELDPHLAGIAQGSLIIGVRVPTESDLRRDAQMSIEGVNEGILHAVRTAVRGLKTVAEHIHGEVIDDSLASEIPDPGVRDALMVATFNLAPSGKRGIERVSFLGPSRRDSSPSGALALSGGASLTATTKRVLRDAVREPAMFEPRYGKFVGIVREMDLDVHRFEIRHVKGVAGGIRCVYNPADFNRRIKSFFDALVEVRGNFELSPDNVPRLIRVDSVKVLKRAPKQRDWVNERR